MTQDEIIEMARQARLMSEYDEASPWVEDHEITQYVEAFAKLVAAKEREACAKVIESHGQTLVNGFMLTEAIRARGE
jgi:hypothetical protein